ncbi:phosphorylase family protein [Streptomyces flavalbus]|uniref:Protein kinase domain-containing protein n=1 Tax=Streptomyces flavalbus TaxID=2665155 RepID=A0ABW2W8D1_9ACTN
MAGAPYPTPTVVVLTALGLEFQAVREHLSDVEVREHQHTLFDVGRVSGLPWRVALAEIGEGTSGAATHTERAIARFRPAAVFFVGVAGGLRGKVALGDVVVASKVYLHHGGKETDAGLRARPRAWEVDHALEQRVRRAVRADAHTHFKPVVSGDVVLDTRRSPLTELIERTYDDAVAIDMESAGMAQAARLNGVPWLAVRGVSDPADGSKKDTDAKGWQPVAAQRAAAVAVRVLRELPPPGARPSAPPEPTRGESVVLVAAPPAPADPGARAWRGGAVVDVGGESCLLHDGPGDLLAETASPDHRVLRRQALARVVPGRGGEAGYVWVRQAVGSYDDPVAEVALRALADEHDLLRQLPRAAPSVAFFGRRADTTTLALRWPGAPCETLAALLGDDGEPLDAWRTHRVLRGLTACCRLLAELHQRKRAHRALTPTALIVHDDGTLLFRDLGLATTPPVPGEAPGPYQAPEQRLNRRARPDAATDVYRLAALTHRILTGTPPVPGLPSGLRAAGEGPPWRTVDAALHADPARRPPLRDLSRALHTLSHRPASRKQ